MPLWERACPAKQATRWMAPAAPGFARQAHSHKVTAKSANQLGCAVAQGASAIVGAGLPREAGDTMHGPAAPGFARQAHSHKVTAKSVNQLGCAVAQGASAIVGAGLPREAGDTMHGPAAPGFAGQARSHKVIAKSVNQLGCAVAQGASAIVGAGMPAKRPALPTQNQPSITFSARQSAACQSASSGHGLSGRFTSTVRAPAARPQSRSNR